MNISYCVQPSPEGLAQAFILGRRFVEGHPSALVLGDNIFYGHDCREMVQAPSAGARGGATVFGYHVTTPSATAWSSSTPTGAP